jgi:hypothetical protein
VDELGAGDVVDLVVPVGEAGHRAPGDEVSQHLIDAMLALPGEVAAACEVRCDQGQALLERRRALEGARLHQGLLVSENQRRDVNALKEAEGEDLAELVQRRVVHRVSFQARFLEGTVRTARHGAVAPRRSDSAAKSLLKTPGRGLIGSDGGDPGRAGTP